MGTWGAGIFADDLASDVRSDWRDAIQDGLSAVEATDRLIAQYGEAIADQDEGPRFWLALAASQTSSGRLIPSVRDRALALIEAGGDIAAFSTEDPKLGRKREIALRKLAAQLSGPQRPPTRMVRPKPRASPVQIGDVLRVGATNGSRVALFVVVALHDGYPPGSTWPVLVGLVWDGVAVPATSELARLPLLRDRPTRFADRGPVIDVRIIHGPSRGPRSWVHLAEVVASGVVRPDVPDYRQTGSPAAGSDAPNVGYTTWENLGNFVGGGWYARCIALTAQHSAGRDASG